MSKSIVNNRISWSSSLDVLTQKDDWINQGVTSFDSPTFSNLQISGDTTIDGNLYVYGNTSVFDSNTIELEDNIILINRGESGEGVTLNQSGIEVDRGPNLTNYRFVFQEDKQNFAIGEIGSLQAVSTREDNPLSNGIMIWNNDMNRIDSKNDINIDISFSSTNNSINNSTGSVVISGGLGINKDIHMNGNLYLDSASTKLERNTNGVGDTIFQLSSDENIYINPKEDVLVTKNLKVLGAFQVFGTTTTTDRETLVVNDNIIIVNESPELSVGGGYVIKTNNDRKYASMYYKQEFDAFVFGYSENTSQANLLQTTNYADLRLNKLFVQNSDKVSVSTPGGMQLGDDLVVGKKLTCNTIEVESSSSNSVVITGSVEINSTNNNTSLSVSGNVDIDSDLQIIGKTTVGQYIKQNTTGNTNFTDNFLNINYHLQDDKNDLEFQPSSQKTGILLQRHQYSNDEETKPELYGKIVSGEPEITDTLSEQETTLPVPNLEIKFSNSFPARDNLYYENWWIKLNKTPNGGTSNQTRKIVAYDSNSKIAQINTPWQQQPESGDIVELYYKNYVSVCFDEEQNAVRFLYTDKKDFNIVSDVDIKTRKITSSSSILISDTTDSNSTSSGNLNTYGGAGIGKKLYVGDNLVIGNGEITPLGTIHLKKNNNTVVLEKLSSSNYHNYITFSQTGNTDNFGILHKDDKLTFTYSNNGETPDISQETMSIFTSGNLFINNMTTFNEKLVGSSSKNELYLSGDLSSSSSSLILSGNGDTDFYSNTTQKNLQIKTTGNVVFYNTQASSNSSSGSVVFNGGISIDSTDNSVDFSNGGAMTVNGGSSIGKDLRVGGDLIVSGNVKINSTRPDPSLEFDNFINCNENTSVVNDFKFLDISGEGLLSFGITVLPQSENEKCSFRFRLPYSDTLTKRTSVIASVSGYSDDNDPKIIFNAICLGEIDSVFSTVYFHSNSTAPHYLQVICRYSTVDAEKPE